MPLTKIVDIARENFPAKPHFRASAKFEHSQGDWGWQSQSGHLWASSVRRDLFNFVFTKLLRDTYTVAPDHRIAPDHSVAPDYRVAPDHAVACHGAVAPDH